MIVDLQQPHRCLSWAPARPGFAVTSRVAWLFLELNELAAAADPLLWFEQRLRGEGLEDAVGLLTSRRRYQHSVAEVIQDDGGCMCVATVGLSNALAAGDAATVRVGSACRTINLLCVVSEPLTDGALVEAVALVAEARAAVLMESGFRSTVSDMPATGTGTDCIVVACASTTAPAAAYCGKHTAVGERIGKAVRNAVGQGVAVWREEFSR